MFGWFSILGPKIGMYQKAPHDSSKFDKCFVFQSWAQPIVQLKKYFVDLLNFIVVIGRENPDTGHQAWLESRD